MPDLHGFAWISTGPGPEFTRLYCTAIVLVSCQPGLRLQVADIIAQHPEAATIEVTVGGADLQLDVVARDLESLSSYLINTLDHVPGITSVKTAFITRLYQEASSWGLGSLDPSQLRRLGVQRQQKTVGRSREGLVDSLDRALIKQLSGDGRRAWADVAAACGTTAGTAKRRVERLTKTGLVRFRCDVSRELADFPVAVSLLASVLGPRLETACRIIQEQPECRMIAKVSCHYTMFINLWLRDLGHIQEFESALVEKIPSLQVHDRLTTVKTVKRMGALFDDSGRRTDIVPLNAW